MQICSIATKPRPSQCSEEVVVDVFHIMRNLSTGVNLVFLDIFVLSPQYLHAQTLQPPRPSNTKRTPFEVTHPASYQYLDSSRSSTGRIYPSRSPTLSLDGGPDHSGKRHMISHRTFHAQPPGLTAEEGPFPLPLLRIFQEWRELA